MRRRDYAILTGKEDNLCIDESLVRSLRAINKLGLLIRRSHYFNTNSAKPFFILSVYRSSSSRALCALLTEWAISDFKIQRRERRRERQKNNRFYKQINSFARASPFFCTFLSHFCTTTTWKCLILYFMEDVNKQRRNFISLSELGYGSLKYSFRRVRLRLTK